MYRSSHLPERPGHAGCPRPRACMCPCFCHPPAPLRALPEQRKTLSPLDLTVRARALRALPDQRCRCSLHSLQQRKVLSPLSPIRDAGALHTLSNSGRCSPCSPRSEVYALSTLSQAEEGVPLSPLSSNTRCNVTTRAEEGHACCSAAGGRQERQPPHPDPHPPARAACTGRVSQQLPSRASPRNFD